MTSFESPPACYTPSAPHINMEMAILMVSFAIVIFTKIREHRCKGQNFGWHLYADVAVLSTSIMFRNIAV